MARPRFVPKPDDYKKVRSLAALGVPHEDIAPMVGLRSAKTLRRHFREDLDLGGPEANARVAQSLFQQATSGKNTAASIFWMKTRSGWREPIAVAPRTMELPPFVVTGEKEAA